MRIFARLAREAMLNRDGLNHLQVELIPPVAEEGAPSKPVLIVFVIDRSGSMGGHLNRAIHETPCDEVRNSSKMSYAISAVINFLNLLTEDNLVGVVSFDDTAEIYQHLTHLNPSTRRDVIENVQRIRPRGCTNISDAILTAKKMITADHLDKYTCKVILLSDGIANSGVSDSDGLASIALNCLREGITVSSLGIGADYDAGKMGAIANSGGGLFYHIQDLRELEKIFQEELGMSNAVTAKSVALDVEIPNLIEISENLNFYPQSIENGCIVVRIGDMFSPKKILFEIRNDFSDEDFSLNIKANYLALDGTRKHNATSILCKIVAGLEELRDAREDRTVIDAVLAQVKEQTISRASEARDRDDYNQMNRVFSASQQNFSKLNQNYPNVNVSDILDELERITSLFSSRKTSKSVIKEMYASSYMSAKGVNRRGDDNEVGRQQMLKILLRDYAGAKVTDRTIPYPRHQQVSVSQYNDEIFSIYQELGGRLPDYPLNIGSWDLEVNGVAVELDEALHFNRYRAISLLSPLYNLLPNFGLQEYRSYCELYEHKCLSAGSYGGKWTSPSAENQFGPAGPPRDLTGDGSPRWRQRAFYDFVKDLSPLVISVPVARISIWDKIDIGGEKISVAQILDNRIYVAADKLLRLVQIRAGV